jgi:Lar family restriction alleviation protein
MKGHSASTLLKAAENADWQQVVLNGGPPCFHLFGERFCLRAERWAGHGSDHEYAPLHSLLAGVDAKERWIGALCAGLQLCNDQRRQYRDALKTASQADKKEGAGEQQSDASEPDLDAEGQIAELSYAALRERDRADALQSRLERAEQDAKRYRWLRENSKFYERIDRDEIDAIHSMALAYLRTAQQGDEGHSDNALSERSTEHPEVAALLKPCPFCGSVAYIHQGHAFGGVFYSVSCVREGCLSCSGPVGRMEDEQAVIDTWNRRAADVNSRDALKTASEPNENSTAAELWAEIYRLRAAVQGPDGFATWQDAAVSERVRAQSLQSRLESLTAELEEARLIAREQNDAHVTANMRAAEAESRLERAEQDANKLRDALTRTAAIAISVLVAYDRDTEPSEHRKELLQEVYKLEKVAAIDQALGIACPSV